MSSKGQVVIPEEIRDKLHLAAGSQFILKGEGDAIIVKTLLAPSIKDFYGLILRARKQAKENRDLSTRISLMPSGRSGKGSEGDS